MRKIIATLSFLAVINTLFSQINLDKGLIAFYPFSGNANDESGNDINGKITKAVSILSTLSIQTMKNP